MSRRLSIIYTLLYLLFRSTALISPVTGDLTSDKQALLDFLNNITHPKSLSWNPNTSVCTTWSGVTCDQDKARVIALHLPAASLLGSIPPATLSRLSDLRTLSLRSNGLQGPFPIDFLQLTKLETISLSNNKFNGPLPSDYATWQNLTVLDLFGNHFNGTIPKGFANLTSLVSLNLANNSFSGEISDLKLPGIRRLNLSNNHLTGIIPNSLQKFGNSSFSGNNLTYQNTLPPPLALPPRKKHGIHISEPAILGIVISICFLVFFVVSVVMIICYVKRQRRRTEETEAVKVKPLSEKKGSKLEKQKSLEEDLEEKRVMFFEGSRLAFNLDDLLGASAEFLGKGSFGMTFKAILEDSKVVAVKRLKNVVVSQKDFKYQMEFVGNIRHENVAPLRAYVCTKDQKLMIYDYYATRSLSSLLHGKGSGEGRVSLNLETRIKIMIGVAKGLAHIHTHKLAHGNIKSSNVFMNSKRYGCISETGLAAITNPIINQVTTGNSSARREVLSYRAPEIIDTRRSTPESDIYGFGILMLEILTSKKSMMWKGEEVDLVVGINNVLNEQWTGEVFDLELLKTPNNEANLIQLLTLGMDCAKRAVVKRPEMSKIVHTLEEIERNLLIN